MVEKRLPLVVGLKKIYLCLPWGWRRRFATLFLSYWNV